MLQGLTGGRRRVRYGRVFTVRKQVGQVTAWMFTFGERGPRRLFGVWWWHSLSSGLRRGLRVSGR